MLFFKKHPRTFHCLASYKSCWSQLSTQLQISMNYEEHKTHNNSFSYSKSAKWVQYANQIRHQATVLCSFGRLVIHWLILTMVNLWKKSELPGFKWPWQCSSVGWSIICSPVYPLAAQWKINCLGKDQSAFGDEKWDTEGVKGVENGKGASLPSRLEGPGSTVSSPSRVQGKAPPKTIYTAF